MKLFAIAGNATVGKDTLCKALSDELGELHGVVCKRHAFADALKRELDRFLLEQTGISAWTTDPAEKRFIRPVLAFWGTEIRRGSDPDYWIKAVEKDLDPSALNILTDLRFENELAWARGHGAKVVYLERQDATGNLVPPANSYEARENALLRERADAVCTWMTYGSGPEGDAHRRAFARRNLLPLLLPLFGK